MAAGSLAFTVPYNGIMRRLVCDAAVSSAAPGKSAKTVRALLDTGATCSCVTENLARELKLVKAGNITIKSATDTRLVPCYAVKLILPNSITEIAAVVEIVKSDDTDIIIGMDIISKGDFAVSNYNGKTQFSFRTPSKGNIDFQKHK